MDTLHGWIFVKPHIMINFLDRCLKLSLFESKFVHNGSKVKQIFSAETIRCLLHVNPMEMS